MLTQAQVTLEIQAAISQLSANTGVIKSLNAQVASLSTANGVLTSSNTQLENDKATCSQSLAAAVANGTALTQQLASMAAQLADCGNVNAELEKAYNDLKTALGDDPTPEGDVLAGLLDHSLAGMDKSFGVAGDPSLVIAAVWERPQVDSNDHGFSGAQPPMAKYSQGIEVTATPNADGSRPGFDYGSTEAQVLHVPDGDWNPADPATNGNLGVIRLRVEEHDQGEQSTFPTIPYNNQNGWNPDYDALNAVSDSKGKLGRFLAISRAKINRFDGGIGVADEIRGDVGRLVAFGTQTARPFWTQSLPVGFSPTCVCHSSQGEFAFVGGYNRTTDKGQMLTYYAWTGQDLQTKQGPGGFPFDFGVARPGLLNSGVLTGMKIFASTDLPIKYPTNIAAVCSVGANSRIEGTDGNAAYLSAWDLSTQANRDLFMSFNGSWIASWMKAVVTSKSEQKAVMVDLTNLALGIRNQYFTTDALYQETTYAEPPDDQWYAAFNLTDPMAFPYGVEAKPEWAPVISSTIDLPSAPNWLLMSEHGDAKFAVACADGNVRTYGFDGTPFLTVHVGDNPVHLCHDKYPGIRSGGPIATCRASRSIVGLSGYEITDKVIFTIQDPKLIDPVASEVGDTHNVSYRYITVCDFDGKQVVNYRNTPLTIVQYGAIFGIGPSGTDSVESGGYFPVAGHPFAVSGSNVN